MQSAAPSSRHRWRNVPLTRERDARRSRWLWTLLLGAIAAAVPVAMYLLQQMECVQVRYRIEELRSRKDRLEESERRLRIERATLESLPSVETRAERELGLVRPSPERTLVVRSGSPGRGTAAPRAPDATR